jgi:putative Ca2+/H+ antiporter (TMEM165/GDT1 family)
MDWKLFASTFTAIFFAEMGDKTQIAGMSLSAGSASKMSVFLGSALALVATSAIAVLAGDIVSKFVPPIWMQRIAGGIFIVLGAVYLFGKGE